MEARLFTCHLDQTLIEFNAWVKLNQGQIHANMTLPVYTEDEEVQGRQFAVIYSAHKDLSIEEKTVGSNNVNIQAEHGAALLSQLVSPNSVTVASIRKRCADMGYKIPPGYELPA